MVLAMLISGLCSGTAYGALYGFGPAEAWVQVQLETETASVTGSITSFGTSFGTQLQTKFETIISAVAVATKQESLSGSVVSDGIRQSSEQFVNAVRAQQQSTQVAKAYIDYNGATGQGYDPCGTAAKNRTLDQFFDGLSGQAYTRMGAVDVAPGHLVTSVDQAMQARLDLHRQKFCTASEAAAGLCTVSQEPGGDTNASLLFESAAPSSLQDQARAAYTQHILGEPDGQLPKAAGGTAAGQTYLAATNHKAALLSIPAYSLAMIQAENTQSPDYGNKSAMDVLTIRVNQYFGGAEAEAWAGALARQTERGLLVEANKMEGLQAWLHHKEYQQNQRLEANLAALLLVKASDASSGMDSKYQQVLSDALKAKVQ